METVRHGAENPFLQKEGAKAWIVWGIAAFFYGYEFLLRASPSVMQTEMQHTFALDAGGLGFIVSLYYWAYSSMQVPAGVLIDRYGPRSILTCAAFICAISTVCLGWATSPIVAGIARFMVGFGSAFALIGTFKLAGNWFPTSRFAFLAGFALTFGTIGATLAGKPLAILVDWIGWRPSLFFLAAIGIVNAILLWCVVHDHPSWDRTVKKSVEHKKKERTELDAWASFKSVIANKQSWFIGGFAAFIYIPITCFGELWGIPYVMKCCFCDRPDAAFITSLMFVGATVGAPLFGMFSDYIEKRKLPLYIGTIGSLLIMCFVLYVPDISQMVMSVSMFILGMCLGSHMILFALIRENNLPNASAVAAGFGNFVCMIIPGIVQYLIGLLLDIFNQGTAIMDETSYSLLSFKLSLLTIPIGLVLALICLALSRETYARQVCGQRSDAP